MNPHFERGQLLYQQSRYDLAEESFRRALADDPDFVMAHACLALCMLERQEWKEATAEAERAIGLAPDMPFVHYVLARVLFARIVLKKPSWRRGRPLNSIRTTPTCVISWAAFSWL